MSKIALNDAQRDSHRATMNIHQDTANRLISENNWGAAKIALELALPHANAISDKAVKSRIFGLLNTARSQVRKARAADWLYIKREANYRALRSKREGNHAQCNYEN